MYCFTQQKTSNLGLIPWDLVVCVAYCASHQIGMWGEFLAELKDAAGASGTPVYTSMPPKVILARL